MHFIQPSVEYWPQEAGMQGVWKQIARACRVSYQSQAREGESDLDFVKRVIFKPALIEGDLNDLGHCRFDNNKGHFSVLEHGTIYLHDKKWNHSNLEKYKNNKYSKYYEAYVDKETCQDDTDYLCEFYVTTNLRVLIENNWLEDLKHICEPTKYHPKRYTFNVITDIGVTREGNRHRANSVVEESSRYNAYDKGKYGNELTYVQPAWVDDSNNIFNNLTKEQQENTFRNWCEDILALNTDNWDAESYWRFALMASEFAYMNLRKYGWTTEKARQVLPLNTKTNVVYTAYADDWKHFLALRADNVSGKSHPNIQFVANEIKRIAKEQKLW